jgi:hypothetical protein
MDRFSCKLRTKESAKHVVESTRHLEFVNSQCSIPTPQHQRGATLTQSLYGPVVTSLSDDYEMVRLEALAMVWVLATVYADERVAVEGTELRLVDSGFATVWLCLVMCVAFVVMEIFGRRSFFLKRTMLPKSCCRFAWFRRYCAFSQLIQVYP